MKADVKALWVAALRSGEYKQGTGKLHKIVTDENDAEAEPTHEYCCLGVLCDLAVKAGVPITLYDGHSGIEYNGEDNWLPEAVRDWAGISERRPAVTYVACDDDEVTDTLDAVNDDYGWDFDRIADAIESQL